MASKQTFRLGSSPLVSAPGIIAWAINGAHFEDDAPKMISIVENTWGLDHEVAKALVMGTVPYEIENETVIVRI